MKIDNPFPTTGYYGPAFFCDREKETATLLRNLKGRQSTTLAAIRRMGKTALIKHVQELSSNEWVPIYTDILPTENTNDLLRYLATSIIHSFKEKSTQGKRIWQLIKSLRPVISYDSYSGIPSLSFSLQPEESRHTIEELFVLLEKSDKPVLFAIDEFQQILDYPETNVDAWLRKIIQELKNTVFIFSGSQQHLMSDLFTNPARPFFRSTQFLQLQKIDVKTYNDFIYSHFSSNRKKISREVIREILDWTDVHTYYVQLLCNRLYTSRSGSISSGTLYDEAEKLLKEQEYVFFGYRDMLTSQQWKVLKAVAAEGEVYSPFSMNFINKYGLGNPASVRRSIESLQGKELIFRQFDDRGVNYYGVYDLLFRRWIETI
jgi:AAA+ ATPase superfamily predicted ATPase